MLKVKRIKLKGNAFSYCDSLYVFWKKCSDEIKISLKRIRTSASHFFLRSIIRFALYTLSYWLDYVYYKLHEAFFLRFSSAFELHVLSISFSRRGRKMETDSATYLSLTHVKWRRYEVGLSDYRITHNITEDTPCTREISSTLTQIIRVFIVR